MMRALLLHFGILRTELRRIFASPLSGSLNILVIGIALSLPAGMYMLLQNIQGLVAQLSGTPQISLFMEIPAGADAEDALRKILAAHPAVSRIEFVSRDRALEQLRQDAGLADMIVGLEKNPLPDAFIVHPRPDDARSLEALRAELAKLPGVELAQLDSAWAYKLEALLGFGRVAIVILASLLSLALVAITFNTIRLQILTQREEIEVSRLIGATNAFIRRPFLYFGAMQGLLGGIAAYLIISISLLLLNQQLGKLAELYASEFRLRPLTPGDSVTLLLFSMYLGWLGAWLSVARHLSHTEPRRG
ncbi:MAG TPA: permease-like cell division protein FtsX [Gallionella sp.]